MVMMFKDKKDGMVTALGFPLTSAVLLIILSIFTMVAFSSIFNNYHHMALAFKPTPPSATTSSQLQSNQPNVPLSNTSALIVDKGIVFGKLGNYTRAIQYFDKALAIDPNDKVALAGKGLALDGMRNYTRAIQYFDKALSLDPNNKVVLAGKGIAFNSLGNYTQAILLFDKALAIDPNDVDALKNKANTLNNLGNYTQAIQYVDKALAIDPKDTY